MQRITIYLTTALVLLLYSVGLSANNIKTISSMDGLSNSAIFSICQDQTGYIWIGTTDGLDIWDGHHLERFCSKDEKNFFAGNAVKDLYTDENGHIWALTYYGLARICTKSKDIRYYNSVTQAYAMTCSTDGTPYIISENNSLYYYNKAEDRLSESPLKFLNNDEECKRLICHGPDKLYCFTDSNIYLISIKPDKTDGAIRTTLEKKISQGIHSVSSTPADNICHFADQNKNLHTFNLNTAETAPFAAIGVQLPKNEKIRAILPCETGVYIGLSTTGVYLCPFQSDKIIPTPIKTGIFRLMKDLRQNIIWAGTDGNGVIRWDKNGIEFEEITYNRLPYTIQMPIRSIYSDKTGTLWCGTKGDGIFTISNLTPYAQLDKSNVRHISSADSPLTNDNVYSLTESKNGIWIGSDGPGVNYYSYSDMKIRTVPGSGDIDKVHVIYEQNDTTLWITTHGAGVYKCRLKNIDSSCPTITGIRKIPFPASFADCERIFSLYPQNDSLIWLGCRFSGIACLNTIDETIYIQDLPTEKGYAANDVYGITMSDKLNLATGCGLISYDTRCGEFEISDDVPNRALHAILNDEKGNLWMSGNYGLVCLNEKDGRSMTYNYDSGLSIVEYSDGACYRCPTSGTLFFGGINGCTIIRDTENAFSTSAVYHPEIHITHYVTDNVKNRIENSCIRLPHNKSAIGIKFSVVDHLNLSNYEFFWRISGLSERWISNGNDDMLQISTLPHGRYSLEIYYHDTGSSYSSPVKTISIRITPPLYAGWPAQILYLLVVSIIITYYIRRFRKKYLALKEELRLSKAEKEVDRDFVEEMKTIIHENIDNPKLSPVFIAERMCISDRVLYRRLGDAQHLKPQRLIREIRMQKATSLLSSTKMTIDEIMYCTGYDNRSTFYKNFKEYYGVTPKEWRSQAARTTIQPE